MRSPVERQGVYTSTLAGRALFQMLGVFAEFERALIKGRIIKPASRKPNSALIIQSEGISDLTVVHVGQRAALQRSLRRCRRDATELPADVNDAHRAMRVAE